MLGFQAEVPEEFLWTLYSLVPTLHSHPAVEKIMIYMIYDITAAQYLNLHPVTSKRTQYPQIPSA